jgi:hypothetical protein
MGEIGRPETSVLNYLTPRNNPEDGIIQFNRGVSLQSRITYLEPQKKKNRIPERFASCTIMFPVLQINIGCTFLHSRVRELLYAFRRKQKKKKKGLSGNHVCPPALIVSD